MGFECFEKVLISPKLLLVLVFMQTRDDTRKWKDLQGAVFAAETIPIILS